MTDEIDLPPRPKHWEVKMPSIAADGVPRCTETECLQFDGKRCRLMGTTPDDICRPAVVDLAAELKQTKQTLVDVAAAARESIQQNTAMRLSLEDAQKTIKRLEKIEYEYGVSLYEKR